MTGLRRHAALFAADAVPEDGDDAGGDAGNAAAARGSVTPEQLRARIARIEGRAPAFGGVPQDAPPLWLTGHPDFDAACRAAFATGLPLGALTEIIARRPAEQASAAAFAAALTGRLTNDRAGRFSNSASGGVSDGVSGRVSGHVSGHPGAALRRGPVLWAMEALSAREHGALHAPGLASFGIDPGRVICVTARRPADLAFILEEAARLPGLALILAEGTLPSFTASRRLALRLAQSGAPLLFVAARGAAGSAAAARFVVGPHTGPHTGPHAALRTGPPGARDPLASGGPGFTVTMDRLRGGRPGLSFAMSFDHATLSFRAPDEPAARRLPLAVPPPDRALLAGAGLAAAR
jgi:protein ImuA